MTTYQLSRKVLIYLRADQITSLKKTIAKLLDKDISLAEKIRMLFREQGIMIASILMTIGMAISVLVEALLPGGGGSAVGVVACKLLFKNEKCLKEWIRNLKPWRVY